LRTGIIKSKIAVEQSLASGFIVVDGKQYVYDVLILEEELREVEREIDELKRA
jgi:hypothetical protein